MLDFFPPIWNGTLRDHYLLLFGVAGGIALITGLAGAWIGARLGARQLRDELLAALRQDQEREMVRLQLSEVVSAVDVVSIEVERLAEAQRFTARLLSSSDPSARRNASPPASITPH